MTGLLLAMLLAGCPGSAQQEDVNDFDTETTDTDPAEDIEGDAPEVIDFGGIVVRALPPDSFCGCSGPPTFQTEETLCGWHLSEQLQFRVQAEHSALGLDGVEGIAKVMLFQHWPMDPEGGINLSNLSAPESDGLFTFQVDRTQLDLPDPPDGNYWLRLEVISKIQGSDGLPMRRNFVIPFVVDTQGPELKIIAPTEGQKLSASASIVFSAEESAAASGVEGFKVSYLKEQAQWEDMDVSFPVLKPNEKDTYVDTLDLTEFETLDTTLRVEGIDCLGNSNYAFVNVRIIAIPRFVEPPTLRVEAGEEDEKTPVFDRIYATQGDGITGSDPEEPPLDLLLTSNLGAYVAWGHPDGTFDTPALVVDKSEAIDARLMDISGDGVPDLVLLSPESNQAEKVVTLWVQDTATGVVPKGTRTFQLKEKRNVQLDANKLDLADVNGNGRPDILVVSSDQGESLFVLHHTGKTAGVTGDPPAYLDYPIYSTGVTGGVDITHLDANMDGAMDVVIGRDGIDVVTTFLNNGTGEFDIGVDSILGFGAGTAPLMVDNLHSYNAAQDLIAYHGGLSALIMLENVGNGYFDYPKVEIGTCKEWWGKIHTGSKIHEEAVKYHEALETGRMVIIDSPIGGFVRGNFDEDAELDLALTTPSDKLVRIYKGVPESFEWNPPDMIFNGFFRQDRSYNAGANPSAIAAGDFNNDGMDDLAIVNKGTAKITLIMSEDGDYHATVELPMPHGPTWDDASLTPSMALVADFGGPLSTGSSPPDGYEDLLVITQPAAHSWEIMVPEGEARRDEEPLPDCTDSECVCKNGTDCKCDDLTNISTPVLLTYLGLGQPDGPDYMFVKSAVSHRMSDPISGATVGYFNLDFYPDVAVSTTTAPGCADDGGNFDILLGGHSPLVSDPTLDNDDTLEPYRIAGRFWPLGGFIGPANPTDIGAAPLNEDELDDLVLIAGENADLSGPDYQWERATAYLTRYDTKWNDCDGSYNQVYFRCCQPKDPSLLCGPVVDDVCGDSSSTWDYGTFNEEDCEGVFTNSQEIGGDPVKVIVDLISFDPDINDVDPIPDVLALSRNSFNFSYFIGGRHQDPNPEYSFETSVDHPNLYAVGAFPVDMDVGDLDADKIPDVVVALESSLVIAYGQDDPIHHFETAKPLEKGPDSEDMAPTGVLMADVNMDGYVDIVTSSTAESRIWVYVSAGDRDFLGPFPFDCGANPVDVVEIDWNNTDCPNLAVVNSVSKSISLLQNEACD